MRRPQRGSQGAAAVEFAIVAVLLIVLVLGIVDFGRLFWVAQAVNSASREGARRMAVGATLATVQGDVSPAIARMAMGNGSAAMTASSDPCPSNGQVEVTVTVPFRYLTPVGSFFGRGWLSSSTRNVVGKTTMRCET